MTDDPPTMALGGPSASPPKAETTPAPRGAQEASPAILVVFRTRGEAEAFQRQWRGTLVDCFPFVGVRLEHEAAAAYLEGAHYTDATWERAPGVEEALQRWAALQDEEDDR